MKNANVLVNDMRNFDLEPKQYSYQHQNDLMRYKRLFELMPTGYYLSTPAGYFKDANPAFIKMLGYKDLSELKRVHIPSQVYVNESERKVSDYIPDFDEEIDVYRLKRKDGQIIWLEDHSRYIKDETGKVILHEGICKDITERVRAEESIKKSQQTINFLMDLGKKFINLPPQRFDKELDIALTKVGEILRVDRAFIFDYNIAESTYSNTHEWCAPGVKSRIDQLQNRPLAHINDWVELHKKNEKVTIHRVEDLEDNSIIKNELSRLKVKSLILLPIMNKGHLLGFVGFESVKNYYLFTENEENILELFAELISNLKERISTMSALEKAKASSENASRAKTEFLANMSHEIRTPMNAIIGFTEILMDSKLNDVQREYLRTVHDSGKSLLNLVNDILDFSKVESGQLVFESVEYDLRRLFEQTVDMVLPMANKKNLPVKLDYNRDIPLNAWVDPLRLKQVLINLMSNGVKFTEKGYVKLKVDFEQKANDIGLFTFTVKDTGIGISKSQKNKLFKAFSQADASYTRRFGGTGLGLVISHRLVANMGGEIEIKSNIDEGSEFSFGLLLKCKKADARASNKVIKKETEIKITTKHKLMVVEDMEENRMLANILLKKFAPNSIATDAVNGMEAFEMYKKTRPELILMDVQMPVLDGNRATELIRRYEKFNGLKPCKIVGLSAGVLAHEREKCLSSGMNDFMAKPIETEKFQQVLCKYLNRNPQTNTKAINQVNQSTLVQSESETMRFDINELNSLMGDETMVKVLLKQLLISLPKRLADLETCFNNNDLSQAAKAAHALKGAALNARCNIMGKMAAKAEHCLKNNEHIDTTETMNQLNQEWHLLKNVLKSRL